MSWVHNFHLYYIVVMFVFYICMLAYAGWYILLQAWKLRSDSTSVYLHRVEHIKIFLLLAIFNISLMATDLSNGVDGFIESARILGSPMPTQYLFMTLFMYFAFTHLEEEMNELENEYNVPP